MSRFARARRLFQLRRALHVLHLPTEDREALSQLADNLHRQFSDIDRWNRNPQTRK